MSTDPRRKALCKFKGNCKQFKQGLNCDYSHDKCKFGGDCRNKENCKFYHQDAIVRDVSVGQRRDQSEPRGDNMCKFGAKCNKLALGLCKYKHDPADQSQLNNQQSSFQPKADRFNMPCRNGENCHLLRMGKCSFKHDKQENTFTSNISQPIVEVSVENKGILSLFNEICLKFISELDDYEGCEKSHEYSTQKNIKKIFSLGQGSPVVKMALFEGYNNEQQPLYILQEKNRIIFGQLVNLAKQSGCENVPVQTLIMKRWYHKDLIINNQTITGMFSLNTITPAIPRLDFLFVTTAQELHVFIINKQKLISMALPCQIKSVAIIGCEIILLFTNFTTSALTIQYPSLELVANPNFKVQNRLVALKNYSKLLYGSQVAIGICQNDGIYFINKNLQCKFIQTGHNIKDFVICEYSNLPICLLLTDNNKIISLNILTFEISVPLNAEAKNNLSISSIKVTNDHLIMAIDRWGVLVFTLGNFASPIGALAMGPHEWKMETDNRGNCSLIGGGSLSIFKIRKN